MNITVTLATISTLLGGGWTAEDARLEIEKTRKEIRAIQEEKAVLHEQIYCTTKKGSRIWWESRAYLAANKPNSLSCNFLKEQPQ